MNVQAMVLGLEKRESERRANKEALSEVSQLTEKLFFTRSVRKTRDGYAVFFSTIKLKEDPVNLIKPPSTKFTKNILKCWRLKNFLPFATRLSKI